MLKMMKKPELDQIMHIWLNENIRAHGAYVSESYWRENASLVRHLIETATVYVSRDTNGINGFCGLQDNYIAGVFIDAKMQGNGIGGQLLSAVQADYDELTLSVYEANTRAVKFYQHHGFTIAKRGRDEDNDVDELTMSWHKAQERSNV
ncbi:hypothetical protein IV55_GL000216 [Furfurilactobacillus siliginis]|nr:hypothetical protein IV55_GL000216 [Furfurilactobacillus siliginis]